MGAGGLASEVEGESGSSLLPQTQESGPPVPPQLEVEASWLLDLTSPGPQPSFLQSPAVGVPTHILFQDSL